VCPEGVVFATHWVDPQEKNGRSSDGVIPWLVKRSHFLSLYVVIYASKRDRIVYIFAQYG
jgi:hypothetical protein